jgi:hypothetical protein
MRHVHKFEWILVFGCRQNQASRKEKAPHLRRWSVAYFS